MRPFATPGANKPCGNSRGRKKSSIGTFSLLYTLLLAFVASFRTTKGFSILRQYVAERLRNSELQVSKHLERLRFDFITKVAVSPCSLVPASVKKLPLPHSLLYTFD